MTNGSILTQLPWQRLIFFTQERIPFDNQYVPTESTRATTNFANALRDESTRLQNLTILYDTFNRRLQELTKNTNISISLNILRNNIHLLDPDSVDTLNPQNYRYREFPLTEILEAKLMDIQTGQVFDGPIGFNLSSYIRDADFYGLVGKIRNNQASELEKATFGMLHGLTFKMQFSEQYQGGCTIGAPVTAISVSSNRTYTCTANAPHPILGHEFIENGESSPTADYFAQMGMQVRYFMPQGAKAPLAFYHNNGVDITQLPHDHLAAIVAVMETFQRIYRPDIYNTFAAASTKAGSIFQPRLDDAGTYKNFYYEEFPSIRYDRSQRNNNLGPAQAQRAITELLEPNKALFDMILLQDIIDSQYQDISSEKKDFLMICALLNLHSRGIDPTRLLAHITSLYDEVMKGMEASSVEERHQMLVCASKAFKDAGDVLDSNDSIEYKETEYSPLAYLVVGAKILYNQQLLASSKQNMGHRRS